MASSTPFSSRQFYGKRKPIAVATLPDYESDDSLQDSDTEAVTEDVEVYDDEEVGPSTSPEIIDETVEPLAKKRKSKKRTEIQMQWKKSKKWKVPSASQFEVSNLKIKEDYNKQITKYCSPVKFFWLFFDDQFLEEVTFQTNLYNVWRSNATPCRAVEHILKVEITKVIGMVLYMGIVKLPSRNMYWAAETRIPAIADVMSRNRFDDIVRTIHFNDNNFLKKPGEAGYDRIYKIRPVVIHLAKKFKEVITPETYLAVDEMMIPFKGRHSLKVYMPKKPTKWGYKLWCLAGVSGYVYDFEISGDGEAPVNQDFGLYENVVLRLTENLCPNAHKVFFDNLFSSPDLLVYLLQRGIFAVSTLRENRSRHCPLISESVLKKMGRGAVDYATSSNNKVIVCSWYDNRRVLVASNYCGIEPTSPCKRFSSKEKKMIEIPRPALVTEYNKFMGGVDKSDMLLSLYRTKCKTRKGYMRIFFHLCSLSVVNAWCIYRSNEGKGPLKSFLTEVARSMMKGDLPISEDNSLAEDNSPSTPKTPERSLSSRHIPLSVRFDRFDHWPIQISGHAMRCKMPDCKRKSRFMCSKCQLHLCVLGDSNCFINFHTVVEQS